MVNPSNDPRASLERALQFPIAGKPPLTPREKSFEGEIRGDQLLLRSDAATAFKSLGVFTLVELLSYCDSFPGALSASLPGWTIGDVESAVASLRYSLKNKIPREHLLPKGTGSSRISFGSETFRRRHQ